jgi:hypothetical protein
LPLGSVAVTKEGGKVVVDENPSTPGLAGWKHAALGTAAHLLRVHLEEGGGFTERQCLHGREGVDESAHHGRRPRLLLLNHRATVAAVRHVAGPDPSRRLTATSATALAGVLCLKGREPLREQVIQVRPVFGLAKHLAPCRAALASLRVTMTFSYSSDGSMHSVRAEARGRTVAGTTVMAPREGRWSYVQVHDGMRAPMTGEVAWLTPQGRKPYGRGTVPSLSCEYAR